MERRYDSTASLAQAQPLQAENERAHLHTIQASVVVPFLQSLTTGVSIAFPSSLILWLIFHQSQAWRYSLVIFSVCSLITWLIMLFRNLQLTAPLERFTRLDLNKDGHIGRPVVRLVVAQENNNSQGIFDLPERTYRQLPTMARALLAGLPLSENTFAGSPGGQLER